MKKKPTISTKRYQIAPDYAGKRARVDGIIAAEKRKKPKVITFKNL